MSLNPHNTILGLARETVMDCESSVGTVCFDAFRTSIAACAQSSSQIRSVGVAGDLQFRRTLLDNLLSPTIWTTRSATC